jgi:hypothetical protein
LVDGSYNSRTFILGAMAYVLFHGFLNSPQMVNYNYNNYFWWIFAIDLVTMAIMYKNKILNELEKNNLGFRFTSKATILEKKESVSKEVSKEEVSKEEVSKEEVSKEEPKAITINPEETKSNSLGDLKNI